MKVIRGCMKLKAKKKKIEHGGEHKQRCVDICTNGFTVGQRAHSIG